MSEQEIERQIDEWKKKKLKEYSVDEDRFKDLKTKRETHRRILLYWNSHRKHLISKGHTQEVLEWCDRERESIVKMLEHYEKQIARQHLVDNLE